MYEAPTRASAPVLLLLHGTGGTEHDLLSVGRHLDPTAGILSPRGQVLENGMPRFFRRLAEGVFDLADLRARTADLAAFVAESAERYQFDPRRVVAAGFSNGANIASSLLLLSPGSLSGAILFRGMVPLEPDPLPALPGTPVLLSNGRTDPLVSPAETERLAGILGRAGAHVTVAWQPGGHGLTKADVDGAAAWLRSASPHGA